MVHAASPTTSPESVTSLVVPWGHSEPEAPHGSDGECTLHTPLGRQGPRRPGLLTSFRPDSPDVGEAVAQRVPGKTRRKSHVEPAPKPLCPFTWH